MLDEKESGFKGRVRRSKIRIQNTYRRLVNRLKHRKQRAKRCDSGTGFLMAHIGKAAGSVGSSTGIRVSTGLQVMEILQIREAAATFVQQMWNTIREAPASETGSSTSTWTPEIEVRTNFVRRGSVTDMLWFPWQIDDISPASQHAPLFDAEVNPFEWAPYAEESDSEEFDDTVPYTEESGVDCGSGEKIRLCSPPLDTGMTVNAMREY